MSNLWSSVINYTQLADCTGDWLSIPCDKNFDLACRLLNQILSMKMGCDYPCDWINKQSHTQKSHRKMMIPGDVAGAQKKKNQSLFITATFTCTIDFYSLVPLSVTLTFTGGVEGSG